MHALLDCIAQLTLPTDASRLFHGRGGRYPGCEHLSLDAYPPRAAADQLHPPWIQPAWRQSTRRCSNALQPWDKR